MAMDVLSLWDFGNPELSEERFRAAMSDASESDRQILLTQIARTYGLRKQFDKARAILADLHPSAEGESEVEARYHLESGRSFASPAHTAEPMTSESLEKARDHYQRAFELADQGGHHYVAVDALHMMAILDPLPEAQIAANRRAIDFMMASPHDEARKWEGSLRNNLGYSLHLAGDYDAALDEFSKSLAAREAAGNPRGARAAKWMIAWTLRAKGELSAALERQLALEKECAEAGEPDRFVVQELEILYRLLGDEQTADQYRSRSNGLAGENT